MNGVCLCGKVRFEVEGPFERITQCHCESCKKLSGGVGTTSGRTRTESVRILEGADLLTTYQPEEGTKKTFCSECGSNLFGGGWPDSEFTSVRVTTLEPPFEGKVTAQIYLRSVAPWETLPDDGAERFDGPYGK
jgi:hypothetical protein